MLFKDVLDEYDYHCLARNFTDKTMKNKRQEYKQLYEFLSTRRGIKRLDSITKHDMKAYVKTKHDARLQPQSIVSMAKQVAAFFNWCVGEEYLEESPMKGVALPNVPKKIRKGFTPDEVVAMIDVFTYKDYISARNKAMIAMLADTGLRSIEITDLPSEAVKNVNMLVIGKGRKERIVYISPALRQILIRYERVKRKYFKDKIVKDDTYFLNYRGEKLSHPGLWNAVKLAGELAGVKDVHPHKFRHYFTVQSTISGIDIYSLSRLLGHSDLSTTQIYLESLDQGDLLDKAIASSPLMNIKKKRKKKDD